MKTVKQYYDALGKILEDNPDLADAEFLIQPFNHLAGDADLPYVSDAEMTAGDGSYYLEPDEEVPEKARILTGSERVVVGSCDMPEPIPDEEDEDEDEDD